MSGCANCGGPICVRQNKSGFCKKCAPRLSKPADQSQRIRDGLAIKRATDPKWLEAQRERARRVGKLPQSVAARRAAAKKINLSEIGRSHIDAAVIKRRGEAISRSRLPWCPPELISEYRRLRRSARLTREEAKAAVLEQHEANLRRLRTRMGVTGPVEVREPNYIASDNDNTSAHFALTYAGAEKQKAKKARIDALRNPRTLCPICGARSDVGCEHGDAA